MKTFLSKLFNAVTLPLVILIDVPRTAIYWGGRRWFDWKSAFTFCVNCWWHRVTGNYFIFIFK